MKLEEEEEVGENDDEGEEETGRGGWRWGVEGVEVEDEYLHLKEMKPSAAPQKSPPSFL